MSAIIRTGDPLSENEASLAVSKPPRWLERPLTLDYKAFFKSLGKIAVRGLAGNWPEALAELPEMVAAAGLALTPQDRAWALIRRALARAAVTLLQEYAEAQRLEIPREEPGYASADDSPTTFVLSPSFFENPAGSDVVPKVTPAFATWLRGLGLSEANAANIANRLPSYFALAIHNEWRSKPDFYQPIREALLSPFSETAERELGWRRYNAFLASQIDEPIFGDTFSLRQIYVEPRGYIFHNASVGREKLDEFGTRGGRERTIEVVRLVPTLLEWAKASDRDLPIRVLSGGPGAGKSSLWKILADKMANQENLRVLLVPLYKLDVRMDLKAAIGNFVSEEGFLGENPIEGAVRGERIVLILDGLDELEMQGSGAQEAAQAFVREVIRTVERVNAQECRLLALISGRELAVQVVESEFRKPGQILEVVPYFVPHKGRYKDPQNLLSQDQRDEWWRKYGVLTGSAYSGIPAKLKEGEIGEVTAQPLLNYLVALSYRRGGLDFSADTNVNAVYEDLVRAVHQRAWAPRDHPAVRSLTEDEFFRLLEEMGIAVWHGDGRTTTLREIENHCRRGNVLDLFPALEQGAAAGISALLMAFYFRQKGRRSDGEKTFEFTHKSFGEYLAARHIFRTGRQISRMMRQSRDDPGSGWDDDQALHRWLETCGPTTMDGYLADFIRREMALHDASARELQESMSTLYRAVLTRSWPMNLLFPNLRFRDEQVWARNAEEALLAFLNAAARVTKQLSKIDWPSPTSFAESLKRVQGIRQGVVNGLVQSCLSYLDLSSCCLNLADLYAADLEWSNLSNADLILANLALASLENADLSCAFMSQTLIVGARLKGANLGGTRLVGLEVMGPHEKVETVGVEEWQRSIRRFLSERGALRTSEVKFQDSSPRDASRPTIPGASQRARRVNRGRK
jgi:uncharacterized protein YjbI with pentapeptide repeats